MSPVLFPVLSPTGRALFLVLALMAALDARGATPTALVADLGDDAPPALLDDPVDAHTLDRGASARDPRLDDDAPFVVEQAATSNAAAATLLGGDSSSGLFLAMVGGGVGAGFTTLAAVVVGIAFWGSLFVGGWGLSVVALAAVPLAFALLPLTASATRFVPRLFGTASPDDVRDALVTFGLASVGTIAGGALGALGAVVAGGLAGAALAFADSGSLDGYFSPGTSFAAMYGVVATMFFMPVGTLLGASVLGVVGAAVVDVPSLFDDDEAE